MVWGQPSNPRGPVPLAFEENPWRARDRDPIRHQYPHGAKKYFKKLSHGIAVGPIQHIWWLLWQTVDLQDQNNLFPSIYSPIA